MAGKTRRRKFNGFAGCVLACCCLVLLSVGGFGHIKTTKRGAVTSDTAALPVDEIIRSNSSETEQERACELTVEPHQVSPGMIVRVIAAERVFNKKNRPVMVLVGGRIASIQKNVSDTELDVMIPVVAFGPAEVRVLAVKTKKVLATGSMGVLETTSQQLVLAFENDSISLLRAQASAGEFSIRDEQDMRRLSYDVLNLQGNLIFSGAIVHPLARVEVFNPPGIKPAIQNTKPASRQVLAIKIPFIAQGTIVRFFDVAPHVDLNTETGRAQRKFLNQITFKP